MVKNFLICKAKANVDKQTLKAIKKKANANKQAKKTLRINPKILFLK